MSAPVYAVFVREMAKARSAKAEAQTLVDRLEK